MARRSARLEKREDDDHSMPLFYCRLPAQSRANCSEEQRQRRGKALIPNEAVNLFLLYVTSYRFVINTNMYL